MNIFYYYVDAAFESGTSRVIILLLFGNTLFAQVHSESLFRYFAKNEAREVIDYPGYHESYWA